jgi:hypothetical protein
MCKVEEEGKDKGMNTSNLELGSVLRKTEKDTRCENEEKEGSVKRNEKAHYILFHENNIGDYISTCRIY